MPVFCSVCSEFLWWVSYDEERSNLLFSIGASHIKVINVNDASASCIDNATINSHVRARRRNTLRSAIDGSSRWSLRFSCHRLSFQLNINVAHHFEQQPFTLKPFFCDHCGSFIRPGHAHKCSREIRVDLIRQVLSVAVHLDCAMVVHRRCTSNVGNYCGCEKNVLALYDKWKATVSSGNDENRWSVACLPLSLFSMNLNPIPIINTTRTCTAFIRWLIIPKDRETWTMPSNGHRETINRASLEDWTSINFV